MKTLLVIYHSMTGGTRQMADSIVRGGTREPDVTVSLKHAADAGAAQVLQAAGYVFASPENLGAISGQMKDFFDRTYYAALDRLNGRPYAVTICAGSDGRNAAQQIERIASGWRLKPIADPLIVCTHAQTPERILMPKVIAHGDLKRCEELGATLAAGIALGIY